MSVRENRTTTQTNTNSSIQESVEAVATALSEIVNPSTTTTSSAEPITPASSETASDTISNTPPTPPTPPTATSNSQINLNSLINRCYAIDEETYACVSVNVNTREGLEFSRKTSDLIKPEEIPSHIVCKDVLENKIGSINSASICTHDEKNIKLASDELFKNFIPVIISRLS